MNCLCFLLCSNPDIPYITNNNIPLADVITDDNRVAIDNSVPIIALDNNNNPDDVIATLDNNVNNNNIDSSYLLNTLLHSGRKNTITEAERQELAEQEAEVEKVLSRNYKKTFHKTYDEFSKNLLNRESNFERVGFNDLGRDNYRYGGDRYVEGIRGGADRLVSRDNENDLFEYLEGKDQGYGWIFDDEQR